MTTGRAPIIFQPRDEQMRLTRGATRHRPEPLQLVHTDASARRESSEASQIPASPIIVDAGTWPLGGDRRRPSRDTDSLLPPTARQSEISFGILDYYTGDHSPLQSPEMPPPTAIADSAIVNFDFGLPKTSSTPQRRTTLSEPATQQIAGKPRAQKTAPATPQHSRKHHQKSYSLFPAVKDRESQIKDIGAPLSSPIAFANVRNNASLPTHQQPDPSYRPRRQSISGSLRSRKDSFNSFRSSRHIPLRIFSSSSTTSTSSPSSRDRCSDEKNEASSPTTAGAPDVRALFDSWHGSDASQPYPDCFFEDDEEVPLRRSLGWKTSINLPRSLVSRESRNSREKSQLGRFLRRVLLCSCFNAT